eukprot:CAMPEP_0197293730 /NCGR_PEP_ID=MMETSP0890-20130614/29720_1 /TAXON_ID=44058 ORGANISM="Aureoumbra lagunensis, Strain CCMP1510" /NCGR_SAMPLE_ID=MMETSP0890 /ASSEMBLY_ACC=CAM_ASM_000533 /LENGTH=57 /DNA_ID=CAMNT_0042768713 /DNA_START=91 /DNA_END=267 /DNA_ORIENTATION=+
MTNYDEAPCVFKELSLITTLAALDSRLLSVMRCSAQAPNRDLVHSVSVILCEQWSYS